MPTSPMLDMGPCELYWGYGDSDMAALGRTLGGVKVAMETNAADILEDQAGDAPVNAVLTGSILTVEATMTRLSVTQLARILNAEVEGHDDDVIPIENQVGCDLYDVSKALLLVPLCGNEPSTDPATWVVIFKAYPIAGLDLTYDKDTQRTFPVKFKCFVCQETECLGKYGTIGATESASLLGGL